MPLFIGRFLVFEGPKIDRAVLTVEVSIDLAIKLGQLRFLEIPLASSTFVCLKIIDKNLLYILFLG